MNTNDLRQVLREDADEAPIVPVSELMAGIQREVKVRRRTRWASAAVAVAVVLSLAIAVVPRLVDTSAPEPIEPRPDQPSGPPFPEYLRGGRLLNSHVGALGATEFTWSLTLKARRVDVAMYCIIPREDWSAEMVAGAWLDGTYYESAQCARRDRRNLPVDVATLYAADRGPELRGQLGEGHTVAVRLYAKNGVDTSEAELGLAFYADAGPDSILSPYYPVHPRTRQFLMDLNLQSRG